MRKAIVIIAALAVACGLYLAYSAQAKKDEQARFLAQMERMAERRSDSPRSGIAADWNDCLSRVRETEQPTDRVSCKSWRAQGIRSELVALTVGDEPIPVVESRLVGAEEDRGIVIDVVGGPGGQPFYQPAGVTEESIEEARKNMPDVFKGFKAKDGPYYPLLVRGFTFASIGYWGTSMRTLEVADEFELAAAEVATAIGFYREESGKSPPLVTTSLGNHLALAALGKEQLEQSQVLALVPMMDGLRHHVARFTAERRAAENDQEPYGSWGSMNVYSNTDGVADFDYARFMPMHDYIPRFLGSADYPWRDVSPNRPCSRIVLASQDPRTKDYLAARGSFPAYVTILNSDHDLIADALDETRTIFSEYAQCLVANQ